MLEKLKSHGFAGSLSKIQTRLMHASGFDKLLYRNFPVYANPTPNELLSIERDLQRFEVKITDYIPSPIDFNSFKSENLFPADYHGGPNSDVWNEKLLEHWVSYDLLKLEGFNSSDIYVDIAAAGSPWAKSLRERKSINAFAIDLCNIGKAYRHLSYYKIENATATTFADGSVKYASLHCAYEMFLNQDDKNLILELSRILKTGGKAVIVPLYMHTHYCAYSTPEYYGKGYSDPTAFEYVCLDLSGVPSSRKYDVLKLKERVLDTIISAGMSYRLLVLRNKDSFGDGIYCHFILEVQK